MIERCHVWFKYTLQSFAGARYSPNSKPFKDLNTLIKLYLVWKFVMENKINICWKLKSHIYSSVFILFRYCTFTLTFRASSPGACEYKISTHSVRGFYRDTYIIRIINRKPICFEVMDNSDADIVYCFG